MTDAKKSLMMSTQGGVCIDAVWHSSDHFQPQEMLILLYLGSKQINQQRITSNYSRFVPEEELRFVCGLNSLGNCRDIDALIDKGYIVLEAEGYEITHKIFEEYAEVLRKSDFKPLQYNMDQAQQAMRELFPGE